MNNNNISKAINSSVMTALTMLLVILLFGALNPFFVIIPMLVISISIVATIGIVQLEQQPEPIRVKANRNY